MPRSVSVPVASSASSLSRTEESVRATDLSGTGIGCGGPLDSASGLLIAPTHLPGWVDIPVTRLAEERFGLPAVLENDGTAGTAGEWRFGAGRSAEYRHLLYLTISTGVGCGLVLDGRTFRGVARRGNGGEPGHVTVRPGGRRCVRCSRVGCLEAHARLRHVHRPARRRRRRTGLPPG
ncbi:ROK family protein [Streptomyces sp. PU-14G]|uniref:ROK family protein n=1 Tax=Streptomyces sp. PU-14G TaxID=2800808 RepID=UPI0034DEC3C8